MKKLNNWLDEVLVVDEDLQRLELEDAEDIVRLQVHAYLLSQQSRIRKMKETIQLKCKYNVEGGE